MRRGCKQKEDGQTAKGVADVYRRVGDASDSQLCGRYTDATDTQNSNTHKNRKKKKKREKIVIRRIDNNPDTYANMHHELTANRSIAFSDRAYVCLRICNNNDFL